MDTIKKENLKEWLVEYLINSIHSCEIADSKEFNEWAKSYPKEELEALVSMEFVGDWGYDKRNDIPVEDVKEYADAFLQRIVDSWSL